MSRVVEVGFTLMVGVSFGTAVSHWIVSEFELMLDWSVYGLAVTIFWKWDYKP